MYFDICSATLLAVSLQNFYMAAYTFYKVVKKQKPFYTENKLENIVQQTKAG